MSAFALKPHIQKKLTGRWVWGLALLEPSPQATLPLFHSFPVICLCTAAPHPHPGAALCGQPSSFTELSVLVCNDFHDISLASPASQGQGLYHANSACVPSLAKQFIPPHPCSGRHDEYPCFVDEETTVLKTPAAHQSSRTWFAGPGLQGALAPQSSGAQELATGQLLHAG